MMGIERRGFIAGAIGLTAASRVSAQAAPDHVTAWPPAESFKLWPERPPNSPMAMMTAAKTAGVPVEAHFFAEGGHGFGPNYLAPELPGSLWPDLFDRWIDRTLTQTGGRG